MNKILYATDFSENAKKAFGYVAKLAQYHHADLIMLHVFDIPTSFDFPYIDDAREMERQAIRESKNNQ
ncbi:MAG: universal stress protein [Ekhidna sp.]